MTIPAEYSTTTMSQHVGHDFGQSKEIIVNQAMIDGFAGVTGDDQWIHVDVEKANAESPFGTTIAHGFLTLSLLAADVINAGVIPPTPKPFLTMGWARCVFSHRFPAVRQ